MCERCSKLRTERKEAILDFSGKARSRNGKLLGHLIFQASRCSRKIPFSVGALALLIWKVPPVTRLRLCSRIFLDVSQNDNTALRRMNLRSFLMAPLQRVTKYPLLLSRIIKATGERHPDHGSLREAKSRVESRRNREVVNIEMREVSVKTVGWARESTRFIMEGPLQLSQPADGQWVKKGSRALKFQNVQSLLMVRTQRAAEGLPAQADGGARGEPQEVTETVQDSVLVLIKDKSGGKFAVLREPIRLANCVVSADPECDDTFEVLDIRREAFVFRASEKSRTQQWFRQIKRYACDLGLWRKRHSLFTRITE
uniref:DH domain-containing protein n=1 Tax=Electrophorus electricus TaxID=8005 RepID=A0AAY5EHY6_ELEEL